MSKRLSVESLENRCLLSLDPIIGTPENDHIDVFIPAGEVLPIDLSAGGRNQVKGDSYFLVKNVTVTFY